MVWRHTARVISAGLVVASVAVVGPARAQGIERALAGIRLNTNSKSVLAKYGSPTQIMVGETGFRTPGTPATVAGSIPADPGAGGGAPGAPGAPGGGPNQYQGAPGGGLPAIGNALQALGFPGAGTPGPGPTDLGAGGAGASVGPFGNTISTLTRSQEVTWVYDRTGISYEFLIGPDGRVIQIKVIGYGTKTNVRTQRGIGLGATFAQLVPKYGYPEEFQQVGPITVTSYRNKTHASFQLLNNKVIAVTIASTE